jgi:hypothetical protein
VPGALIALDGTGDVRLRLTLRKIDVPNLGLYDHLLPRDSRCVLEHVPDDEFAGPGVSFLAVMRAGVYKVDPIAKCR